jgi:hypothetical protein
MPNPASTTLQIIVDKYHNFEKHLHLFNTAGQLLLQKSWADVTTELNVSHLPQGVYFIKIVINGQIQTKKIALFR